MVTDHTGWFGPARWAAQQAAAAATTSAGFAALVGYEATMSWGHVTVYGGAAPPHDELIESMDAAGPEAFYDWLAPQAGAVAQWNHPTWKSAQFSGFAGLTAPRQAAMAVVEVVNAGHRYETSYVKALDGGSVIAHSRCSGHAAAWSAAVDTATAVAGGAHYVYLRVVSASGRVAWTAPIWTGLSR